VRAELVMALNGLTSIYKEEFMEVADLIDTPNKDRRSPVQGKIARIIKALVILSQDPMPVVSNPAVRVLLNIGLQPVQKSDVSSSTGSSTGTGGGGGGASVGEFAVIIAHSTLCSGGEHSLFLVAWFCVKKNAQLRKGLKRRPQLKRRPLVVVVRPCYVPYRLRKADLTADRMWGKLLTQAGKKTAAMPVGGGGGSARERDAVAARSIARTMRAGPSYVLVWL
jgi:hypothetical protein